MKRSKRSIRAFRRYGLEGDDGITGEEARNLNAVNAFLNQFDEWIRNQRGIQGGTFNQHLKEFEIRVNFGDPDNLYQFLLDRLWRRPLDHTD
jgi:transposase-like protein